MRDERLNETIFISMAQARAVLHFASARAPQMSYGLAANATGKPKWQCITII